jgi:hypothetical protein
MQRRLWITSTRRPGDGLNKAHCAVAFAVDNCESKVTEDGLSKGPAPGS